MKAAELFQTLSQFIDTGTPATFYDAMLWTRALQAMPSTPDGLLAALIVVHDELATDGAKPILADYLRSVANVRGRQSELAQRPILLADSGKTARLAPGGALTVELEERRTAGMRWSVEAVSGPLEVEPLPRSDDPPPRACYRVHGVASRNNDELIGRVRLREGAMEGRQEHRARSMTHRLEPRSFELVVELDHGLSAPRP